MSEACSPVADQADEELVRLVLAGEVEVFAHLYHRYYSRVYRLAYGMLGRHEAAEDLTQEILYACIEKSGSLPARQSSRPGSIVWRQTTR
jgi:DNA-directed RNA polymerase specialized sigma24 family protein